MEEVDKIIMSSLRECGCEFVEDQSSISAFSTENVVEAAVKCLRTISPELKMSHSLPPGMSARFRIGTALAQACQSAGYRGDVGYQTFLYSSEADIRRLFMFLVERLPRKKDEAVEQTSDKDSALLQNITRILKEQLSTFWLPLYCKKGEIWWLQNEFSIQGNGRTLAFCADSVIVPEGVGSKEKPPSRDLLQFYREKIHHVHDQLSHHSHLAPSLMERNVSLLSKQYTWANEIKSGMVGSQILPKKLMKQDLVKLETQMRKASESAVDEGRNIGGISLNSSLKDVANMISVRSSALEPFVTIDLVTSGIETDASKDAKSCESVKNKKKMTVEEIGEKKCVDFSKIVENHIQGMNGDMENEEGEICFETEEETIKRVEKELKTELDEVIEKMGEMELDVHKFQEAIIKAKEGVAEFKKSNQIEQEKVKLQKKTLQLLPDADSSIRKLEEVVAANKKKMASLGQQWEKHKTHLQERFDEMKEQLSQRETQTERKVKEVKLVRQRIKESTEEIKRKEQLEKQLIQQSADITRDISRKSHTKRIFEIVANIRKQKQEIQRALTDMTLLQKEMNQLEGRVERTFTAADDLFFMDAKSDDSVCQSYKYLASLNLNCSQLLRTVEQTGEVMREIKNLEEQVATEGKKNTAVNLEKITRDFKEMKKENMEMMQELKSITASSPKPRKSKS